MWCMCVVYVLGMCVVYDVMYVWCMYVVYVCGVRMYVVYVCGVCVVYVGGVYLCGVCMWYMCVVWCMCGIRVWLFPGTQDLWGKVQRFIPRLRL